MLFYSIILLGVIGLCLGIFIAFQPGMLFSGIALLAIGAGLALLGFAVKKVVDGLKEIDRVHWHQPRVREDRSNPTHAYHYA